MGVIADVRPWIASAVVIALLVGPMEFISSPMVTVILMLQMTASMEGLVFRKVDLSENRWKILLSVVCTFGICTGTALLSGIPFMASHPNIWYGWVMLAAVPCAVSVITAALYMKGDLKLSVLSTAVIYVLALIVTPLITFAFMGDAVDPSEIFPYVLLSVAVPMVMTVPLRRVKINQTAKRVFINAMMFLLILTAVGNNRDFATEDPTMVLAITVCCILRMFAVSFILLHIFKKRKTDREESAIYVTMSVWKNSGLAVVLCMVLLADSPEAAMPCVISLVIECIWFAFFMGYFRRSWPDPQSTIDRVNI